MEYYKESVNEVLKELKTTKKGITDSEANIRLAKFGYNSIEKKDKNKLLEIISEQFKDFLVILLLFAGLFSLILGNSIEAIAIFVMVLLSVVLGFVQEYKAEKSLEKLKKITSRKAVVLRNNHEQIIDAIELVPGDIVLVEAGSIIPADIRIIESSSLKVDESSLTGESVHRFKESNIISKTVEVSDRINMAFMGTVVVYGSARGIVVETGLKTEFGKIADSLTEVTKIKTPMQRKLAKLGKQLIIAVTMICIIVFVSSLLQGRLSWNQAILVALSLAVAAAPSSLPAVVTISLSRGVMDLAKKKMLVKKLPAAEGLGSATFICTDKTGTLTKNEMSIQEVYYDNKLFNVGGVGYSSEGTVLLKNKPVDKRELLKLLHIGMICNESDLILKKEGDYEIIGDPTEVALIVLGNKMGFKKSHAFSNYKLIQKLPFDSDRKMMSVICQNKSDKKLESFTKGASRIVLDNCNKILLNNKIKKLTPVMKRKIISSAKKMESSALRVLALSFKYINKKKKYSQRDCEKEMVFVGLVGMLDPAREGVKESIEIANKAGINVMMITGDSPITAKAIAEKIGLFRKKDYVVTGSELKMMSDAQLSRKIAKIRICARFMPIQKLRIVDALQKKGNIVAMTGDGVNDSPAIKKADLGISMGITGTEVAKEVSQMTLADDNFSTIVSAIEEGRNIYDKILKSVRYLLSCNTGEIFTIFFALLLNLPIPLIALQILIMNLLTDGLPAIALSMDPVDHEVMLRKPRNPKDSPLSGGMLWLILTFGVLMAAGTLFLFNKFYVNESNFVLASTIAFTTLVVLEMVAVLSSRTLYRPAFSKGFFSNGYLFLAIISSIGIQLCLIYMPILQKVFGTTGLNLTHWLYIIGVSILGFIVMEASKKFIHFNKSTH